METVGPAGDSDCGFNTNGSPNGSPRKRQSLTVDSNETAE